MTEFQKIILTKPKKVTPEGSGKFDAKVVEWEGHKAIFKHRIRTNETFRGIPKSDMHYREAVAYDMDVYFGFDQVPETRVGKLNGIEGSYQTFVSNAVLPYELVPGIFDKRLPDWRRNVKTFAKLVDTQSAMKMVIFDLIIGNVDRHARNAMFTIGNRKSVEIDNGCSFGRYYELYRSVFHKYLFHYFFPPVSKRVTDRLQGVKLVDVEDVVAGRLPPSSVRHTYWRLQFVLSHIKDLSFRTLSQGHFKRDDFPDYREWFKKRMRHASPAGPMPVVFDTTLYEKQADDPDIGRRLEVNV